MTRMPEDDDRFDHYMIRGKLRERPKRFRGRDEAIALTHALMALERWKLTRPDPKGEVYIDIGYRLCDDPLTAVGVPISYATAELVETSSHDQMWMYGPPVVAVEFNDPSREPLGMVFERVTEHLSCGTRLVWVVEPDRATRSVQVFRLGELPILLRPGDVLSAAPELPGFSCPVADFFR